MLDRIADGQAVEGMEALAPHLARRGRGSIVNLASVSGLRGNMGRTAYGASKGAVVTFRGDEFKNPMGLVGFVQKNQVAWKIRPDHKVVVKGEWETPEQRLGAAERILTELSKLAA